MVKGKFEQLENHRSVKRYIPTIGKPAWDINSLTKEERSEIKKNIKVGITTSEEEYKAVIAYMYMKFPDLFDLTTQDNLSIQWRYSTHKNKSMVKNDKIVEALKQNKISRSNLGDKVNYPTEEFDMYALVYYDTSRDNEPVLFGGSYLKEHKIPKGQNIDEKFIYDKEANTQIIGHGYVLHTDVNYRRMGLAVDSWVTESQLYRDSNIEAQYEIQNQNSLSVTQSMFSDPNKCKIVAPGRLKNDGTRAGIRVVLDYSDRELVDRFNNMESNMKDFYKPMDWSFLEREGLTIKELNEFWD